MYVYMCVYTLFTCIIFECICMFIWVIYMHVYIKGCDIHAYSTVWEHWYSYKHTSRVHTYWHTHTLHTDSCDIHILYILIHTDIHIHLVYIHTDIHILCVHTYWHTHTSVMFCVNICTLIDIYAYYLGIHTSIHKHVYYSRVYIYAHIYT